MAVQQNIVVLPLHAIHILAQHCFPAHHVHQPYLYGRPAAILRYKVKAFVVMHDLQVAAGHCPRYYIIQDVDQSQGQVMELALAQHLGQVPLGGHVQQQDQLPSCRRWCFSNAALLILCAYHLCFAIWGVSPFIDLAACGETDGYV